MSVHPPARELLLLAIDNGWNAQLVHGVDTGGSTDCSRAWLDAVTCH